MRVCVCACALIIHVCFVIVEHLSFDLRPSFPSFFFLLFHSVCAFVCLPACSCVGINLFACTLLLHACEYVCVPRGGTLCIVMCVCVSFCLYNLWIFFSSSSRLTFSQFQKEIACVPNKFGCDFDYKIAPGPAEPFSARNKKY